MIERFIYTALREGIEAIQKDPTILEDLFKGQFELTATEVAAIKTLFAARPPNVMHGYANAAAKFPLYAIVLADEGEETNFIGDDGETIDDEDDPDDGDDVKTAIWGHTFQIHVVADHPDAALYYYQVAKSILLASKDYFVEKGCFGFRYSGMDLNPDPRYIPENLFLRQITFRCQREFQRLVKVQRAFKVTGIYVDSSGSTSDVGDVKTNVTILDEGSDGQEES